MPPDGYNSIMVSDEVIRKLVHITNECDCDSLADAVETAATIALERDDPELAQVLDDLLTSKHSDSS